MFSLLLGPAVAFAAEPEIIVELSAKEVYEGQSVLYRVTLNNVENAAAPELAGFDEFDVALTGSRPVNLSFTSNINGRVTKIERRGAQFDYRLTPRRAGRLTIPAPQATVDGKVLTGEPRTLNVLAADDQDVVLMELRTEPESVYPMQPFTVTLSILIRELPEPYREHDPTGLRQQPALRIPWAGDGGIPEGLQPRRSSERWRESLRSRTGAGFSINNLARRDIMSLMEDDFPTRSLFGRGFPFGDDSFFSRGPRLLVFQPTPRQTVRSDGDGNDRRYWQYDFERTFTPKRVGRCAFPAATIHGPFVVGESEADAKMQEIYALAEGIEVEVKDVPLQGRPASYIGAVGEFTLAAELAPKRAKVGDPMTLTLRLAGEGTLDEAYPPELAQMAAVRDRFKVYDATEKRDGDTREFTYSLRPLDETVDEFPSVPVSYFDVKDEQYVTLRSEPIGVEIGRAEKLTGRQIVAARNGSAGNGNDVELRREGIFANVTDVRAVGDETVRPGRWLAGLGGMAAAYALLAVAVTLGRRRLGDAALQRRQTAASRARSRLRQARAELDAGRDGQVAEHVRAAVTGLVADMAALPEAGLTPRNVRERLTSDGVEQALTDRVHALLQTCDAARYGATDATAESLVQQADEVLGPLAKQLKTNKRPR